MPGGSSSWLGLGGRLAGASNWLGLVGASWAQPRLSWAIMRLDQKKSVAKANAHGAGLSRRLPGVLQESVGIASRIHVLILGLAAAGSNRRERHSLTSNGRLRLVDDHMAVDNAIGDGARTHMKIET